MDHTLRKSVYTNIIVPLMWNLRAEAILLKLWVPRYASGSIHQTTHRDRTQLQYRNKSPVYLPFMIMGLRTFWIALLCTKPWNLICKCSKLTELDSYVWMIDYLLTRFRGVWSYMLQGSCTKGPEVECLYWPLSWGCKLLGGIFYSCMLLFLV